MSYPINQAFADSYGQWWYSQDGVNVVQVAPPQMTTEQKWEASQQRRAYRQAAPQPQYQPHYAPQPQYGAPAPTQGVPLDGYSLGGSTRASMPPPASARSHGAVQPGNYGQVHNDRAPNNTWDSFEYPAEKVSTPTPAQAPAAAAPAPVPEPVSTLPPIVETHSGYEAMYDNDHDFEGLLSGMPFVFDVANHKGIFILNGRKEVEGFKLAVYKETDVQYEKHETANFYGKRRAGASRPNANDTEQMLAEIQRKAFLAEMLEALEVKDEGNVTGSKEVSAEVTYVPKTLYTNLQTHDYIAMVCEELEVEVLPEEIINFELETQSPVFKAELKAAALELTQATDWYYLNKALNELVRKGLPLPVWDWLNTHITTYINTSLKYRLGIEVSIGSFNTDIDNLVPYLMNNYKIRESFSELLAPLLREFKISSVNAEDFQRYLGYTEEEAQALEVDEEGFMFTQLTDVTILPIESSSLYIPIPNKAQQYDVEKPVHALVTPASYPSLFNCIESRFKYKSIHSTRVVFVTADRQVMRLEKTQTKEAYVLVKE